MSIIIFVGPSLPRDEALALLAADYRPPAKAGDVYAATLEKPLAIGIIDGFFEAVPAVWHKEIMCALNQGIHVYGASSMGALRAAELQPFGMKGVGRIFESFASGELEDDDEVALIHAPEVAGYTPFSEPMVNIREGLRRALAQGILSSGSHDLLVRIAKAQFYPERSWMRLAELGGEAGIADEVLDSLLQFVRHESPDLKRKDARLLIHSMAEHAALGFVPFEPEFQFERSVYFDKLTETVFSRKIS